MSQRCQHKWELTYHDGPLDRSEWTCSLCKAMTTKSPVSMMTCSHEWELTYHDGHLGRSEWTCKTCKMRKSG